MKKLLYLLLTIFTFSSFVLVNKNNSWKKIQKKHFSFVPSGNVIFEGKTSSVQSFFMSKGEVTNREFGIFLDDLKTKNRLQEYENYFVDTNAWGNTFKGEVGKLYSQHYFSHPAYFHYPVVNVSFEAAQAYCVWFSEKINENLEEKDKLIFRLPTMEEFLRAAKGDNNSQIYSWKGDSTRNEKGNVLCNHLRTSGDFNGNLTEENNDIIAPSKSYWLNKFGIYNLNGNVAEMISEKGKAVGGSWRNDAKNVKNESILSYEKPEPNVGFRIVATKVSKVK